MKMKNKAKWLPLLAMGCALQFGGCFNFESLGRNIWFGFGSSLGGIPAGIVTDIVVAPLLNTVGL